MGASLRSFIPPCTRLQYSGVRKQLKRKFPFAALPGETLRRSGFLFDNCANQSKKKKGNCVAPLNGNLSRCSPRSAYPRCVVGKGAKLNSKCDKFLQSPRSVTFRHDVLIPLQTFFFPYVKGDSSRAKNR